MVLTFWARLVSLKITITLLVCLVLCIMLFAGVRFALYRDIDGFLTAEINELQAKLEGPASSLTSTERRIRTEIGVRRRGDFSIRVLDTKGAVLISSSPNGGGRRWLVPEILPGKDEVLLSTDEDERGNVRTCSKWIELDDGASCIAQTTYRLDDLENTLWRFGQFCGLALLTAAVLSALGGHVLARQALLPISQMSSDARQISVENLNARLVLRGSGDELDQLAKTFNEMFERLESQVEQLRQFTADAAHELRTPLAALRGTAEVAISQNRTPEELRATLVDSIEEYDRLSKIAEDLLLLARADAGQLVIRQVPLELNRAIRDIVDLYLPLAEEAGVHVSCDLSQPVWVLGDDGRIRQMLGNILDNAIKYSPKGAAIHLRLLGDNPAILTIADTGAGIAAEDLAHVFDRFYRADRARQRERGTGLGLAISQTIVRAHGGNISLESTIGKGTTVTVRLPKFISERQPGV